MRKNINDLRKIIAGKKVYIWGAMIVGQGVCRALERFQVSIDAFIDSSKSLQGKAGLGYPILSAQNILEDQSQDDRVIIISSGHYDLEIEQICIAAGLRKDKHYVMSYDLNDVDPSVDISGTCNLRCISCPCGNIKDRPPAGFMTSGEYRPVLDKLLRELPFLGSIQLYAWGEPLLNKNLAQIVKVTREAKVLTALSSNLNVTTGYREVVAEKLDWFKISASGFEKSYEITHTGGKWTRFLHNLEQLVRLREKYHPEMHILLNYHLYKHNIGGDYRKMKKLCDELEIIFRPSPAYLYPLDNIRDHINGKPLSKEAMATLDLLLMGIDEGIAKALERKNNRCPEERCLPIAWDRKVRFCGVYYNPFICDDFLTTPLSEILKNRVHSTFCKECKDRGLHQFTGVYLAEKTIASWSEESDS